MLVYGDHQFSADLHVLCTGLQELTARAQAHPQNLELVRTLLIACGQVEQAAHDAFAQTLGEVAARAHATSFHAATAAAAAAFYSLAHRQPEHLPTPRINASAALRDLSACLHGALAAPNLSVAVKTPEGFNLHALYPEQYVLAAGRWLADHGDLPAAGAPPVIVVGIRSIGTTLAAVVATVLRAAGLNVDSFTVRPGGHPYARVLDLGIRTLASDAHALVVDEGPGISGSSMAAVAAALAGAGIADHCIAFLPGHTHDPGGMGSEEVRRWWRHAPRYVAGADDVTFDGMPLLQALAAHLPEETTGVDNLSGGVWRRHLYPTPAAWPPICNHFERVKHRFTLRSGRQVLCKFLGMAAATPDLQPAAGAAITALTGRVSHGLATPPLALAHGFMATEWLPGIPLARHTAPGEMPEILGAYVARIAGPALTERDFGAAVARIADMIYVNTTEALGAAAAEQTRRFQPGPNCPRLVYGDGHLQPYEWLKGAGVPPQKVDGVGHSCDHTLIGLQSVAWDVAGAMVEWELDVHAAGRLLQAYHTAGGLLLDAHTLQFYRLAYAAFRTGQCALASEFHDPNERERLVAAYAGYRQQLALLLTACS
jgi:hypothetical protein